MGLPVTPLQIGGLPGGPELLIILALAVLLFGASKIPKLARSSGQAIGEFQRGKVEAEEELQQIREETEDVVETDSTGATDTGAETTETDAETTETDAETETETESE